MQDKPFISLNAVRVFEIVARHLSIKDAAAELNVTPSAVSHQLKALEETMGVALFVRQNNSINLSEEGRQFYQDATPGLMIIDKAVQVLQGDCKNLVLRISVTLAVRWLIPKMETFKKQHPEARIRVETSHNSEVFLNPAIDLAITYCADDSSQQDGIQIFKNILCPALTPALLDSSNYKHLSDISKIPAINCNAVPWVWKTWAGSAGVDINQIRLTHEFDTDDSAIHGAIAGMGMVLAPLMMLKKELATGVLVLLPHAPQRELGYRRLLSAPRLSFLGTKLRHWLIREASLE